MSDPKFGDYPWDHWKKWAIEDGVDEDLAQLGRLLIREADQHGWSLELKQECGWSDNGEDCATHQSRSRLGNPGQPVCDGLADGKGVVLLDVVSPFAQV